MNLLVVRIFVEGGWIMYPILLTSIAAVAVIVERQLWWRSESKHRDLAKLEQVYAALEKRDVGEAVSLARSAKDDAVLRVLGFGLNHWKKSTLESAFQVAAGIELERAGRFVVALDTIVTLAPLLGLLGTVTGLMRAFFKLGNVEISEQAIGGGIAEALIATACGLSIAIVCLVFLNYFAAKVSRLQFEMQIACGKTEVLLNYHQLETQPGSIASPLLDAPDPSGLTPPSFSSAEDRTPPTL